LTIFAPSCAPRGNSASRSTTSRTIDSGRPLGKRHHPALDAGRAHVRAFRRHRCCWLRDDKLTAADLALAAYERALEPKRLALMPGGHFDPYLDQFPLAAAAATEWFREHLLNRGASRS
jgi:hypothetical protein